MSRCAPEMPSAALAVPGYNSLHGQLWKGKWWQRVGSNHRPNAYEASALPLSYVAIR